MVRACSWVTYEIHGVRSRASSSGTGSCRDSVSGLFFAGGDLPEEPPPLIGSDMFVKQGV
jgi:hypothetical protein